MNDMIWDGANMGWFLRFGNWSVAKLLQILFNTCSLTDVGCTYRLVKRRSMLKILKKSKWKQKNNCTIHASASLSPLVPLSRLKWLVQRVQSSWSEAMICAAPPTSSSAAESEHVGLRLPVVSRKDPTNPLLDCMRVWPLDALMTPGERGPHESGRCLPDSHLLACCRHPPTEGRPQS